MILGHLGQLAWLTAGSRAMPIASFGVVLAAQALYSVLQLVVDNGATYHGARLVASHSLEGDVRAEIIRVRLQLAALAALVALAVGLAGGSRLLLAVAPFLGALPLFALFAYWERFGKGDSRPWSSYLVVRSWGTAALALIFVIADREMPVYAVGVAECLFIAVIAAAVRINMLEDARLAIKTKRGPWRSVIHVGLPGVIWQAGLAAGPVLLSLGSANVAAAQLGVSTRTLNGLNQLAAVTPIALFPSIAARRAEREADETPRTVGLAVLVSVSIAAAANGVLLVSPEFFVGLFLEGASADAHAAAVAVFGSAVASCLVSVLSLVLIARGLELIFLRAAAIGVGCFLVGAGISIALKPDAHVVAMIFSASQAVAVVALVWGASRALAPMAPSLVGVGLFACAACLGAILLSTAPTLWPAGAVFWAFCAFVVLAATLRRAVSANAASWQRFPSEKP